jgi:hypothetical protein
VWCSCGHTRHRWWLVAAHSSAHKEPLCIQTRAPRQMAGCASPWLPYQLLICPSHAWNLLCRASDSAGAPPASHTAHLEGARWRGGRAGHAPGLAVSPRAARDRLAFLPPRAPPRAPPLSAAAACVASAPRRRAGSAMGQGRVGPHASAFARRGVAGGRARAPTPAKRASPPFPPSHAPAAPDVGRTADCDGPALE